MKWNTGVDNESRNTWSKAASNKSTDISSLSLEIKNKDVHKSVKLLVKKIGWGKKHSNTNIGKEKWSNATKAIKKLETKSSKNSWVSSLVTNLDTNNISTK